MHETVFESRLAYIDALKQMGGEIEVFDQCLAGGTCRFHETHYAHSAVVRGRSELNGAAVEIPDVRGGIACLIAAATAKGASTLSQVQHLERGYDLPFEKFTELGLSLSRA
jgi:UDP-N-acetylglucosamine 1-carboxyvinyltransferase